MRKLLILIFAICMVALTFSSTYAQQGGLVIPDKKVQTMKPRYAPFVENGLSSKYELLNYLQGENSTKNFSLSPMVYTRLIGQAIIVGTARLSDFNEYVLPKEVHHGIENAPIRNLSWMPGEYAVYAIDRSSLAVLSTNRASRGSEPVIDLTGNGNVCINMLCGNIMIRNDYVGQGSVDPSPREANQSPNPIPTTETQYYNYYNYPDILSLLIVGLLLLIVGLLVGYLLGSRSSTTTTHTITHERTPEQRPRPTTVNDRCTITTNNNYYDSPQRVNAPLAIQPVAAQPAAAQSTESSTSAKANDKQS